MTFRIRRSILMAAGAILFALSAGAHHSGAMFDDQKSMTLAGIVKTFQWGNHREGDVLRIDPIARDSTEPLAPRAWVSMLSAQAHFTERLRLIDADTLED